jgi:excisionase family DNA binding protein
MGSKLPTSDLLTVAQAAAQKGVSRSAVYKAIGQGRLASQIVLGKIAISQTDVAQWDANSRFGPLKGQRMSEEAKAKISEGQKRRWAKRKKEDSIGNAKRKG